MHKLVFKILRYSGLALIFREVFQRRKVTILIMHDMTADAATKAFLFWKQHYNVISLKDYLDARQHKKELPPKSLVLTFDDGHKGNFQLLTLIESFRIPVTIFLCSGIVGTNRHFWFTEKTLNAEKLKYLPDDKRIREMNKNNFFEDKEYPNRQALSAEEIKVLKESPFVELESHTRFHPILTQCSDEKAFKEINDSKKELSEKFDLEITGFAYPNGNYSDREILMVKKNGYEYALTADPGFNTLKTDPYLLKRLSVNDSENFDEIVVKTSGLWGLLKKIFRKDNAYH